MIQYKIQRDKFFQKRMHFCKDLQKSKKIAKKYLNIVKSSSICSEGLATDAKKSYDVYRVWGSIELLTGVR